MGKIIQTKINILSNVIYSFYIQLIQLLFFSCVLILLLCYDKFIFLNQSITKLSPWYRKRTFLSASPTNLKKPHKPEIGEKKTCARIYLCEQ